MVGVTNLVNFFFFKINVIKDRSIYCWASQLTFEDFSRSNSGFRSTTSTPHHQSSWLLKILKFQGVKILKEVNLSKSKHAFQSTCQSPSIWRWSTSQSPSMQLNTQIQIWIHLGRPKLSKFQMWRPKKEGTTPPTTSNLFHHPLHISCNFPHESSTKLG